MNNLIGTWIAPDFLNGNLDSGKFIIFHEDDTYVVNDGMVQAEAKYNVEGNDKLILEPALGLSTAPLRYAFATDKIGDKQRLVLTIDKGIVYTFFKKD